jgi:hypothetical protein
MATSSSSNLPHDILVAILTQLKEISETNQYLTSCCLVNYHWYEAATPILYGNIALKEDNLVRFCGHLEASKYGAYVHSLTISLSPGEDLDTIAELVPLISQFKKFRSFSIRINTKWLSSRYDMFIVSHTVLVRLVDALPSSCTNLELDTFGFDARKEGEQVHLCDSLRKILPRMEHVRLRLRTCEALFADPSIPDSFIRLPNIKTFIYNCYRQPAPGRPWGMPLPTCRCTDNSPITHSDSDLLWYTVTANIEKLVSATDAVPEDAKIYVFMTTDRNDNDRSLWQAHIRADMQSQSNIALPSRTFWFHTMTNQPSIVRLLDGSELVTFPSIIEAVAEGQLWRNVVGGARLPSAVLADRRADRASFAVGCVEMELRLRTSQQWKETAPDRSTLHWNNEKLTGVKLLSAEERKGKDEYLVLRQIREITPQGWRRVPYMNDVLKRIEG